MEPLAGLLILVFPDEFLHMTFAKVAGLVCYLSGVISVDVWPGFDALVEKTTVYQDGNFSNAHEAPYKAKSPAFRHISKISGETYISGADTL